MTRVQESICHRACETACGWPLPGARNNAGKRSDPLLDAPSSTSGAIRTYDDPSQVITDD
jgi:hypothetical protein